MAKQKIPFIMIDESVVQYGFRVLMSGYKSGLFESNPVMLLMHSRATTGIFSGGLSDDILLPIGKWYDVKVQGQKLVGYPEFDDDDEMGLKVEGKVVKGYLNACSVALVPLEVSDEPGLKLAGQTGPTITKWEIQECSIVDIPNCRNALAIRNAAGKVITLSDIDASKKDEVLTLLRGLAVANKTENTPVIQPTNPPTKEVKQRSERVKAIMAKSFRELYLDGGLMELQKLDMDAFYEKFKEGNGFDHPNAPKADNEAIAEKDMPYTEEVKDLMKQSGHDLYMNGGLEKLRNLNTNAFYSKYKEFTGKPHRNDKNKQNAASTNDFKVRSNDSTEVKSLMAKDWRTLWLSGESEQLFEMNKQCFFDKYKEGHGVEHPSRAKYC